jgi:tetratricopeptide (TPR) repeat protein
MTRGASLSMVMIARNESHNVRRCFASFWDHVDEVVLCDTGSRDGTVAEARRFAKRRREPGKLIVGHFEWCDDFAAARNHAHSLATSDVHAYIDLDEVIIGGAEHLRCEAQRFAASPRLGAIDAPLEQGYAVPDYWASGYHRLFRAPVAWINPVWERVQIEGEVEATTRVRWCHQKNRPRGRRDLELCMAWLEREPDNANALQAAAKEAMLLGELQTVLSACDRALAQELEGFDIFPAAELRADFLTYRAMALWNLRDGDAAAEAAHEAVELCPGHARARSVLAIWASDRGDHEAAWDQSRQALFEGGLLDPGEFVVVAGVLAHSAQQLGRQGEGLRLITAALRLAPPLGHPSRGREQLCLWSGQLSAQLRLGRGIGSVSGVSGAADASSRRSR